MEEGHDPVQENNHRKMVLFYPDIARYNSAQAGYSYTPYSVPHSAERRETQTSNILGGDDTSSTVKLAKANIEKRQSCEFATPRSHVSLVKQGTIYSAVPKQMNMSLSRPPSDVRCTQQILWARLLNWEAQYKEVSCTVGPRTNRAVIRERTAEQHFGFQRLESFDPSLYGSVMIGDTPTQGVGIIELSMMLEEYRYQLLYTLLVISNESFVEIDCIFSEHDMKRLYPTAGSIIT